MITSGDFPGFSFETWAGPTVLESNAHKTAVVKACVRILSETVAAVDCKLKRVEAGGNRAEAAAHPSAHLLSTSANAIASAHTFKEVGQAVVALWGNFYARIERDPMGNAVELWPLPAGGVTPKEIIDGPFGKVVVYRVQDHDGRTYEWPSTDMFHIPAMGFDGIEGRSLIADHRQAIGLTMALEQHQATFMGKGAAPGGVLEHPGVLRDSARTRLEQSWLSTYSGARNAGKVAILEEGMKYNPVMMPFKDAQFIESRKFQLAEMARIFRIPLHMLEEMDRATFNNIEHRSLEFATFTMLPWFKRWEAESGRKLIRRQDRGKFVWEFEYQSLLRGDMKSLGEALGLGRQWGWLTANDCRRMMGMNTVGPDGDKLMVPMNMNDASRLGEEQEAPAPAADDSEEDELKTAKRTLLRLASRR